MSDLESNASAELTVIVVSYNTKELTLKALETLYSTTIQTRIHVIVLDNCSSDGSGDAIEKGYSSVELIKSRENLGFAGGNNVAAERAQTDWILLLNPDTECHIGAIDNLLAFAKAHPQAQIFGGRTVFPDGSLNIASCWRKSSMWSLFCSAFGLTLMFKSSDFFNAEAMGAWQRNSVREVDIVSGCFFLTTKKLWDQLKGFDPTFYMYGEETDFCLRAKKLGHKLMITPDAEIMHLVGASTGGKVNAAKTKMVYGAKVTLIRKHWPKATQPLGRFLLKTAVFNRALAYKAARFLDEERFAKQAENWGRVWSERKDWTGGFPDRLGSK